MLNISAKDVSELRNKTGAGIVECKKALVSANGCMDMAVKLLKERGMLVVKKVTGRTANEGTVTVFVGNNFASIIEMSSETDFVGRSQEFIEFSNKIAEYIITLKGAELVSGKTVFEDALIDSSLFINDKSCSLRDLISEKIAIFKENIGLKRVSILSEGNVFGGYIHPGGSVASIVSIKASAQIPEDKLKNLAKDLAMHTAATAPVYLSESAVPKSVAAEELAIYLKQALSSGKTEETANRISKGKLVKFFSDNCFLKQPFVKEQSVSIENMVSSVARQLGVSVAVLDFKRFKLGE